MVLFHSFIHSFITFAIENYWNIKFGWFRHLYSHISNVMGAECDQDSESVQMRKGTPLEPEGLGPRPHNMSINICSHSHSHGHSLNFPSQFLSPFLSHPVFSRFLTSLFSLLATSLLIIQPASNHCNNFVLFTEKPVRPLSCVSPLSKLHTVSKTVELLSSSGCRSSFLSFSSMSGYMSLSLALPPQSPRVSTFQRRTS